MRRAAAFCLAGSLFAGCSAPTTANPPGFGDAVRLNMVLQIVDPSPPDREPPSADGLRSALMLQRYRVDQVEKPEETRTSTQ